MSATGAGEVIRERTRLRSPPLVPEIRLHLADEITPIWEAMEARSGGGALPPPYWAFAWAGSIALARLVLDRSELVRGRGVLDFGSGCALAGLAALRAGARRALALDVDPLARDAASLNASANGLPLETRTGDLVGRPLDRAWDTVLAGDVCYEQPTASRVLAWLGELAAEGRRVLIADPGRAFAPSGGLEELARFVVPTSRGLESCDDRETPVWRLVGRDESANQRLGT